MKFASAFKVAGILLLFIAGIFVVYANAIFLKRRSREIGLYQLIGLTKGTVARLLIIENVLSKRGRTYYWNRCRNACFTCVLIITDEVGWI